MKKSIIVIFILSTNVYVPREIVAVSTEQAFATFMEKKYGMGWRFRILQDADYIAMVKDHFKEINQPHVDHPIMGSFLLSDMQRLVAEAEKTSNLMAKDSQTGMTLVMLEASLNGGGFVDLLNALSDDKKKFLLTDKDIHGQTVLMKAAAAGQIAAIKKIVQERDRLALQVNGKDNNGKTALHYAVEYNRPDAVKALLSSGADDTVKDNDGMTPLEIAQKLHLEDIIPVFANHMKKIASQA